MSRINQNISSMVAQRTLGSQNSSLNKSLQRLSTGLRINRGADDPAGLIASENLRSEKAAINSASKAKASKPAWATLDESDADSDDVAALWHRERLLDARFAVNKVGCATPGPGLNREAKNLNMGRERIDENPQMRDLIGVTPSKMQCYHEA